MVSARRGSCRLQCAAQDRLSTLLVLAPNLSALLRRRCGADGGCALYTPLVRPCGTSASLPVGVAGDTAGTRRSGEVLQRMQPAAYTATRDLNGHLRSSPIRRTQHNKHATHNMHHAPMRWAAGGGRRPVPKLRFRTTARPARRMRRLPRCDRLVWPNDCGRVEHSRRLRSPHNKRACRCRQSARRSRRSSCARTKAQQTRRWRCARARACTIGVRVATVL